MLNNLGVAHRIAGNYEQVCPSPTQTLLTIFSPALRPRQAAACYAEAQQINPTDLVLKNMEKLALARDGSDAAAAAAADDDDDNDPDMQRAIEASNAERNAKNGAGPSNV